MESPLLDSIALRRQPSRRGAAPTGDSLVLVRELDAEDIPELTNPSALGRGPSEVLSQTKRIRHTHHLLAMALANGADTSRASQLTGYAPQTIRQLQIDPTFKELIAHYQTAVMSEFEEIRARAASLGLSFLDELQARLEDSPEQFTNKEVRENAAMLLDRTVLPSKAASLSSSGSNSAPAKLQIEFVDSRPAPPLSPPQGALEGTFTEELPR